MKGSGQISTKLCVVMCVRTVLSSASLHNATQWGPGSFRGVVVEVELGDDFMGCFHRYDRRQISLLCLNSKVCIVKS